MDIHLAYLQRYYRYVMNDVDHVGGSQVVMNTLLDEGLLDGDCPTVTGATVAENLEALAPRPADGTVLRPASAPIAPTGGITILRGSLAPEEIGRASGRESVGIAGVGGCVERSMDIDA